MLLLSEDLIPLEMNERFLSIGLVFTTYLSFGQTNLVPNGSFEDTVQCPTGTSQITRATAWMGFRDTPDYFNICNHSDLGVPMNGFGHQNAFDGHAYAGFIAYEKPATD